MKRILMFRATLVMSLLISCGCSSDDDGKKGVKPVTVVKTNPIKVYMHYMPWFQSKAVSGYWGSHWKMKNKNPEVILENGQRQIASHYYPLIGPYDSKDPDVVQYHLLLMKYAGVDAVLIDWYGSHNVNDYKPNLEGANAFIDKVDDAGLQFGIVYEEFTAEAVDSQTSKTAVEAAQQDMVYMQENYFSNKSYLNIGDNPALLTFGPRFFKQGAQWESIFSAIHRKPTFLPLWDHSGYTGTTDNGEYAWVDFTEDLSTLQNFYNKILNQQILIGSAFPRFHDYYKEGGAGESYGYVDADGVNTLKKTLEKATTRQAKHLQLVTWNDFGEGTVIEPTIEDGFSFLETIQEFTGVSYTKTELELVHRWYLKKKEYEGNAGTEEVLGEIFNLLAGLEVDKAQDLLDTL
jgi:glycoprotein endo-alpha-1,2-mannosidase